MKVQCRIGGSDETCTMAHGMEKGSRYDLHITMQSTTTAHANNITTGQPFSFLPAVRMWTSSIWYFQGRKFFLYSHQQAEPAMIMQANSPHDVSISANERPCISESFVSHRHKVERTVFLWILASSPISASTSTGAAERHNAWQMLARDKLCIHVRSMVQFYRLRKLQRGSTYTYFSGIKRI